MLDIMARQDANAKFLLTKLEQENIILKEENEKLQKQNEWLPIETAPKDGTWILVYQKYNDSFSEIMIANYYEGNGCWSVMWDSRDTEINPTYWMPLPTPPAQ
jgi:hypothetical protein